MSEAHIKAFYLRPEHLRHALEDDSRIRLGVRTWG